MTHAPDPRGEPPNRWQVRDVYVGTLLGIAVFAQDQFELTAMIGGPQGKRIFLAALILSVGLLGFPSLGRPRPAVLREPVLLLCLALTLVEVLTNFDLIRAASMLFASYSILLVLSGGRGLTESALRTVVVLAAVFATMAIAQALLLTLEPELIRFTVSQEIEIGAEGAGNYRVLHPIAYLGLTPGQVRSVFGVVVPRMQSFLREPGLLVSYFLLPGAVALTYKGAFRLLAVPIIVLALLGFTGTVYVSLVLGVALWPATWFRPPRASATVAAGVIVGACLALAGAVHLSDFGRDLAERLFRNPFFLANVNSLEFLDRYGAAVSRLDRIYEFRQTVTLGSVYANDLVGYVGLIWYGTLRLSFIGTLLVVWVLFDLFRRVFRQRSPTPTAALGGTIVVAIFIEAAALQQYGFPTSSGLLLTALVVRRFADLAGEPSQQPLGTGAIRLNASTRA